ncbi:ABC transporter substrate-binding protein [Desulfotignum balticum]|jgi:branched-chain amino acid transport system substrate-binding protein|uniref:ABC transporter substrate-binding protein n=1 Tax=Desulfotignum balticum TaxID=115781 RepID=UPI0004230618|nr:ABC transporter substrate-binding protein [Desulfotignum balticum]
MIECHFIHDPGHLLKQSPISHILYLGVLGFVFFSVLAIQANARPSGDEIAPIIIGLDADMSSASAESGQSIYRGARIAVEEINAGGGVLGRFLALAVKDHRGNPARAKDNMADLAAMPDLVAILGGLHTPVALEVLPFVHEQGIPFLIPWAAGTPVVDNGYDPNFVFRVSVRDSFAGEFLVQAAFDSGFRRPGLLLENTGWGWSNHEAMMAAIEYRNRNMDAASVQWFNWGVRNMQPQLAALVAEGADVLLLVANAPEGQVLVRSMAALPATKRLPVISHWGISGGEFASRITDDLTRVTLSFLQTFNFAAPPFPGRADTLFSAYRKLFPGIEDRMDIPAAPGLAHAYDLVHLLAKAVKDAGTTDRAAIRNALETMDRHAGVMADYQPPFTPERHDALGPASFILARLNHKGQVVPVHVR